MHPGRVLACEEPSVKKSPPPASPTASLRKDEMEFHAFPGQLEVQIWDYHADPVHLSHEDLSKLGLTSAHDRTAVAPSRVAPWRKALREGRRDTSIPQLTDEETARALHTGGVAWLPVADGLDVYIVSYHAAPVRLEPVHLARLGLSYRKA
jgi:hypothetical protein